MSHIAESIIRNKNSILPVSSLLEGEYGLSDLCLSVPTIVNSNGAEQVIEIDLNSEESSLLNKSAGQLKEILSSLDL